MQAHAIQFDRLNVSFLAGCGFLVHQFCFLAGCRTCIHLSYNDIPLTVNYTEVEHIAWLDQLGWSSNGSVNQDSAALDTLGGKFPGLVEASGPQPLFNTHLSESRCRLRW